MSRSKIKKKTKFVTVTNLLNLNVQDVINYVHKLHDHIRRQGKKINKLKLKIRKMAFLSKLDAHLAKTAQDSTDQPSSNDTTKKQSITAENDSNRQLIGLANKQPEPEPEAPENVLDFVNEIKAQAMVNSFEQAGFIYEPTSGLYYDTKSKYYYSPPHDLYYNGSNGNWYRLNPRTNEFTFHSGTQEPDAAAQKEEEIDEDEAIRKILEDGRKPTKAQDSLKSDDKVEKESRRRRYSSSSDVSSDDSRYRRRRYRSRSRSKSRSRKSRSKSRHRDRKKKIRDRSKSSKKEDGELNTSEDSESEPQLEVVQEKYKKRKKKKKGNDYEEIAKKYPPSLRLIVIESEKMDVGKLFVVTYKGGTLGREGNHDVLIPEVNVSKSHLQFVYNHKKSIYQFVDRSRNGTLLDGVQMSFLTQEESDPNDLPHGSVLQLAKTKLLCHVHEGLTTCNECEPYNYAKKTVDEPKTADEPQPSNLSHKEQLKLLQKRYGLNTEKYLDNPSGTKPKNYEDRAEKRRVKVGSFHGSEKTEQASVNQSISSDNKGFKLLSKMGWSEGKSIGKSQEGIKEPVQVKTQQGTSGLGSDASLIPATFRANPKKKAIWNKTQERYNNLRKQDEKIFGDDDDDD